MWYLTAEMVPLELFSKRTPSDELRQLADRLLTVKSQHYHTQNIPAERFGTGFGKPKFQPNITHGSKLADFVTQDSWFRFSLLGLTKIS